MEIASPEERELVGRLRRALEDRAQKSVVREYAAVALGLMVDTRSPDVLFEFDADFNLFATTVTTNELIRLY